MTDSQLFAAKPKIARIKRTGLIIGIICFASILITIFIFCTATPKNNSSETIEAEQEEHDKWLNATPKSEHALPIAERPDNSLIVDQTQEQRLAQALAMLEQEKQRESAHITSPEIPAALTSPIAVKLDRVNSGLGVAVGTLISTVLLTELTSDLPGEALAQVARPVLDAKQTRILVPQGSKILLHYESVAMGQNRISLKVTNIIFPNGTNQVVDGAVSLDRAGNMGLHDQVNHHYVNNFFSTLIPDLASAAQYAGQTDNFNAGALAGEFASYHSPQLQRPTIHIRRGYQFNLLVTEEIGTRNNCNTKEGF